MRNAAHPDDAGLSDVTDEPRFDAVVVGAGFSGLYMLYRLRGLGLSVRVLEAADAVGGTWYWNRYPGARVDGHSFQYSYSFSPELEQEWHWPELYSAQPELEKYLNHVADRFNLREDIEFNTRVVSATYDEDDRSWLIETETGQRMSCHYFISAVGCLSATNVPSFEGIDSFEGEWYHTSRWPKDEVDFAGKRAGVIGTGSTGVQIIPAIAGRVDHLYVFQRTAHYTLPSMNRPTDPEYEAEWKRNYAEHRAAQRVSQGGVDINWITFPNRSALSVSEEERNRTYEEAWGQHVALLGAFNDVLTNLEANETAAEFVRNKIRSIVNDPEVAEVLCPKDYPLGGKRVCIDTGYYETYNRENVTLVDVKTHPIVEITPKGLRTTAEEYELDILIFATGFDAMTGAILALDVVGEGGVELKKKWEAGPRTYLGLQTAGFPNMFTITGPGSPSVLSTMSVSIEQHVDWITDAIEYMRDNDFEVMEPEESAEDAWVEEVNDLAKGTMFQYADNWYLGANIPGKPRVFMPYVGGVGRYREKCDEVVRNGYEGFRFDA